MKKFYFLHIQMPMGVVIAIHTGGYERERMLAEYRYGDIRGVKEEVVIEKEFGSREEVLLFQDGYMNYMNFARGLKYDSEVVRLFLTQYPEVLMSDGASI